jgi:hypothetical protein
LPTSEQAFDLIGAALRCVGCFQRTGEIFVGIEFEKTVLIEYD